MSDTKAPKGSSQHEAAPGEGRDAKAATDGKTVGSGSHMDSDVPAPGNTNLGKGGATSMSNTDNSHPGAGSTPASGLDGKAGDPEPNSSTVSKEQPEEAETRKGTQQKKEAKKDGPQPGDTLKMHNPDGTTGTKAHQDDDEEEEGEGKKGGSGKSKKNMTIEEANSAGDGTFGDGKFDAAAPGAVEKAHSLEKGARKEAGEDGKIEVPVK